MTEVVVGSKVIKQGGRPFVIAEAGSNHDRDLAQAKKLIDVAVAAGADAVKFQVFTADRIAADTDAAVAKLGDEFGGVPTLYQLYKGLELPREWQRLLKEYADAKGIMFLATPFDYEAVDELDALGVLAFKVASFEMVDLPFLRYIARKGKPIFLSTGMATLGEIEEALNAIYETGNRQVVLMHCGSSYPLPYEQVNLAAIDTMVQAFGVPVGYSDHTLGVSIPIAVAARGGCAIEKHFTLSRNLTGPDHKFAVEPEELKALVQGVQQAWQAIGSARKGPAPTEMRELARGRRSIFARTFIPAGTVITADMVAVLRPGIGLAPKYLDVVVGRRAARDIKPNEPITWDVI